MFPVFFLYTYTISIKILILLKNRINKNIKRAKRIKECLFCKLPIITNLKEIKEENQPDH